MIWFLKDSYQKFHSCATARYLGCEFLKALFWPRQMLKFFPPDLETCDFFPPRHLRMVKFFPPQTSENGEFFPPRPLKMVKFSTSQTSKNGDFFKNLKKCCFSTKNRKNGDFFPHQKIFLAQNGEIFPPPRPSKMVIFSPPKKFFGPKTVKFFSPPPDLREWWRFPPPKKIAFPASLWGE